MWPGGRAGPRCNLVCPLICVSHFSVLLDVWPGGWAGPRCNLVCPPICGLEGGRAAAGPRCNLVCPSTLRASTQPLRAQDSPRGRPLGLKMAQVGPHVGQEGPKIIARKPNIAPRCHHHVLKEGRSQPKRASRCPPKPEGPGYHQEVSRGFLGALFRVPSFLAH